jgi:dTDP-4-amino-4,6-dideoxygalactose transaminase
MDPIMEFANLKNIVVVEDAAQAVNSKYKNRYAGSIGHLGTFSFHATKSYSCGEGGAILINDNQYNKRSNFLWEKGTDRSLVLAGVKNKYSWVDWGSSFLLSDILASLLFDQLRNRKSLQKQRKLVYELYSSFFSSKSINHFSIPIDVDSNYHAFWIELDSAKERENIISKFKEYGVSAYIGYVPLHDSPKGSEVGVIRGNMVNTIKAGDCLLRLPFYNMKENEINHLKNVLNSIFI